jgi:hypothetical protein
MSGASLCAVHAGHPVQKAYPDHGHHNLVLAMGNQDVRSAVAACPAWHSDPADAAARQDVPQPLGSVAYEPATAQCARLVSDPEERWGDSPAAWPWASPVPKDHPAQRYEVHPVQHQARQPVWELMAHPA